MMMATVTVSFVMMVIILEQERTTQIHRQSQARDSNRFIELDTQRSEHSAHRFAGH